MRTAIRKHLGDFLAILALILLATGVGAYVLANQRLRFPLVEEKPFVVKAELENAQAVTPGQGQTIRTAGVEVGQIGKVELEDGIAVVELQMRRKYKGLIRRDATALLRSKTGLKDMFIDLDPGGGKPLRENQRIALANTAPDIDPDEILSALDTDTRDYLRLLINGGGKGLRAHGTDLRETFRRFEPLHRDLARVTTAIARRRSNLRRLIHNYGLLTTELGKKDREITRLVRAANAVFESFAAEDQNISRFVARLPGSLRQTKTTLAKVNRFGQRLGPALNSLRPPFRKLDDANRQVLPFVTEATPIIRKEIRPFTRVGTPFLRDLGPGARDLAKAGPNLSTTFGQLNRLFNIGAYNPGGAEGLSGDTQRDRNRQEGYLYHLGWLAQNTVSLFSTSDANGPLRRVYLGGLNCTTFLSRTNQIPAPLQPLVTDIVNALGSAGICVPPSSAGP